ncbi:SDR family NAD(P)-dependent oxidoreductase [Amycolatopsis sp. GM8]|uniref:SDR family NAD(P)-dependent oxidoreductase n=1 Tax=Amycolatopsis sp. GM8 TaxID=2896530 RepID=UPI001F2B6697|nr:SDR family oxidoreductase [Amycolatopsis sp. GM8]
MTKRRMLVTGGTGSVGQAIVRALTHDGHAVDFLYNRSTAAAEALAADTGAQPRNFDLAATSAPEIVYDYDVLVHSAAVLLGKQEVASTPLADYELTMAINVRSAFLLAAQCLPHMIEQGWGRIVNVGSVYSLRGGGLNLAYNVSKHALSGLTKNLARAHAAQGITSNEVCPSAIESDIMTELARQTASIGDAPSADVWLGAIRKSNPTGSMAAPEDIAGAVRYLVSDEARFVNGASLVVDGAQIS